MRKLVPTICSISKNSAFADVSYLFKMNYNKHRPVQIFPGREGGGVGCLGLFVVV